VMIRVFSTSQNRDWAKKTLDQFVEVMNIEERSAVAAGNGDAAGRQAWRVAK
jgi:sulfur carrier protein ThiS